MYCIFQIPAIIFDYFIQTLVILMTEFCGHLLKFCSRSEYLIHLTLVLALWECTGEVHIKYPAQYGTQASVSATPKVTVVSSVGLSELCSGSSKTGLQEEGGCLRGS